MLTYMIKRHIAPKDLFHLNRIPGGMFEEILLLCQNKNFGMVRKIWLAGEIEGVWYFLHLMSMQYVNNSWIKLKRDLLLARK